MISNDRFISVKQVSNILGSREYRVALAEQQTRLPTSHQVLYALHTLVTY